MRLDHLLSKEKERVLEVYCLFFNVLLYKYIEFSIYVALLQVLSDGSKK